jgi:hypothetical protein
MKDSIFIGKEAEGTCKGYPTVFIPCGFTCFMGQKRTFTILKDMNIPRLYFGAKNRRGIDKEDAELIFEIITNLSFSISIEIDDFKCLGLLPDIILNQIEIIYVIKAEVLKKCDHIKIEDQNQLIWYPLNKSYTTQLNDPLYLKDKELIYEID